MRRPTSQSRKLLSLQWIWLIFFWIFEWILNWLEEKESCRRNINHRKRISWVKSNFYLPKWKDTSFLDQTYRHIWYKMGMFNMRKPTPKKIEKSSYFVCWKSFKTFCRPMVSDTTFVTEFPLSNKKFKD